jgi:hypothetical protein
MEVVLGRTNSARVVDFSDIKENAVLSESLF